MTKQASVHSCYYYNGSFSLESLSVIFLFVSLLFSAPPHFKRNNNLDKDLVETFC